MRLYVRFRLGQPSAKLRYGGSDRRREDWKGGVTSAAPHPVVGYDTFLEPSTAVIQLYTSKLEPELQRALPYAGCRSCGDLAESCTRSVRADGGPRRMIRQIERLYAEL